MLNLACGDDRLVVQRVDRELPKHLAGNLEIRVEVVAFTYRASEVALVWRQSWLRFIEDMRYVARHLRSRAVLWGALPDELSLVFHGSGESATVSGYIARHETNGLTQRLQFALQFESGRLGSVLHDLEQVNPTRDA